MESSIEYIIYHFKILNVILYFHNFGQRGRVKMCYRVLFIGFAAKVDQNSRILS